MTAADAHRLTWAGARRDVVGPFVDTLSCEDCGWTEPCPPDQIAALTEQHKSRPALTMDVPADRFALQRVIAPVLKRLNPRVPDLVHGQEAGVIADALVEHFGGNAS